MISIKRLESLTRLELYSLITALRRENNCLKTDLIQYEIHLNRFQKFFEKFSQTIDLNEELLELIQEIKVLNIMYENQCFIAINKKEKNSDMSQNISGDNEETNDSIIVEHMNSDLTDPNVDQNVFNSDVYYECGKGWVASTSENSFQSNNETIDGSVGNSTSHIIESEEINNELGVVPIGRLITSTLESHYFNPFKQQQKMIENSSFTREECPDSSQTNNKLIQYKPIYRCDWKGCAFECSNRSVLFKHKVRHREDSLDQTFQKKNSFIESEETHIEVLEESRLYMCHKNNCNFKTKELTLFKEHLGTHMNQYKCQICNKVFTSSTKLETHKKSDCTTLLCNWPECGKRFRNKTLLVHHMNVHTKEVSFRCGHPGCGKTFLDKRSFGRHLARHKAPVVSCQWPFCNYKSNRKDNMKTHINSVHLKGHNTTNTVSLLNIALRTGAQNNLQN